MSLLSRGEGTAEGHKAGMQGGTKIRHGQHLRDGGSWIDFKVIAGYLLSSRQA
ncbi:hypothetical protein I79_016280 [Cricetulus griseus]|uniref:Uncharacterized protein n=1 Tax=Cricetulus griseus TaxID=10029 RepID=G3HYY7_CRIGR|nr:hypothetical protein I79_016280 [Cricetulus griseus]